MASPDRPRAPEPFDERTRPAVLPLWLAREPGLPDARLSRDPLRQLFPAGAPKLGRARGHPVSGEHGEEPTLVVCIRCVQRFRARSQCPHCADLRVAIIEDDGADPDRLWFFEVWQDLENAPATRAARVGGFVTRAEANDHAREFLQHYVAQRRASRRTQH